MLKKLVVHGCAGLVLWLALAVAVLVVAPVGRSLAAEASAPSVGLGQGGEDRLLAQRLDAVLDAAVAKGTIVGAVVMAARNGQLVYQRALGLADVEKNTPMRLDTRFRLASMSKPIVSAAALALADRGLLSLDDPVTRWIPSFTPIFNGRPAPVITIRHLLTHTAGLSYGFLEPADGPMARAGVSDGLDDPPLTLKENIGRLASVPLFYEPGTGWKYSLAVDVLGEVVASAGGGTLPDVVRRLITGPLGMTSTGFVANNAAKLATPYVWADGAAHRMAATEIVPNGVSTTRYQPKRALDARAYPSGGAGMVGDAQDYLKFLEAVRQNGGGILKPATALSMSSDQIRGLFAQKSAKNAGKSSEVVGSGWGFGFGAAVLLDPAKAAYAAKAGAWSWSGAYGTHFFMDKASGISFVALTNTTPTGMAGPLAVALARAVYGQQ